jgi:hypothetical protein
MLAMDFRAPLGIWLPALSLTTIASMLAPTEGGAASGQRQVASAAKRRLATKSSC